MTTATTIPNAAPPEAPSADVSGADDTQVTPESPDSSDPPESADDTAGKGPNAEAIKYRTKLRAAEVERDQLAATVQTLQRAEVGRLAGAILAQGGDLLELGGHELADVLNEDGMVDPERVTELAKELQLSRPRLSKHGIGNLHMNFGQVAVGPANGYSGGKSGWAGVIRGR
ncbi:hypothetical protein CH298_23035 [Rhodococcoides fascians]|uniref:hypothetical protein n=1 Tax=Rhodococcoides fascians TaxID=1828 RepID=UPI000B9B9AAF|nr:hypothetical protein [Rhodococcus fascians]OZE85525.1 hypothetical protein CH303_23390 [Rhodococcus fascians]OZF12032.1 hypothetical protein CH298_23035 [Rhodococcus fascians]OZF14800.1 hypothetical protein CH297_23415 [Rhodococcus fascians]OZF61379.1 hypothetical protein CH308_23035 [Rhodococcus fascians]OZF64484.1 hypothetical protein CH307_23230 [Rhodococcus fascians]